MGNAERDWGSPKTERRRTYYGITSRDRSPLADQRRQWQAVDETDPLQR